MNSLSGKLLDAKQAATFQLPEKVLQFGTGVLLRGLPDFFIDKANKLGLFNGRIVMVKSTDHGNTDAFEKQDGVYTHCIKGVEDGKQVSEYIINTSISRVLSAKSDWEAVLKCAENPSLQIIISNTTEVGIQLVADNVHAAPPASFPGKLLSFLYHRFRFFNGDADKGLVIIPTELLPDNGNILQAIVLELSHQNGFESGFIDWLENANFFCNSLVDRIVPGKLAADELAATEALLGYKDDLMIMSEVFRLWAIETNSEKVKQILSFAPADKGVVLTPDINVFRELKLRLLNGTHTFSCSLAYLSGFETVKDAMQHPFFGSYIEQLMFQEILPVLEADGIDYKLGHQFATQVADRFRNPYLAHEWINITMQYTSKMRMRNVVMLQKAAIKFGEVPQAMVLGFAAYLYFMNSKKELDGKYFGNDHLRTYEITDDKAPILSEYWSKYGSALVVPVLSDESLWGANLNEINGFASAVIKELELLVSSGVKTVLFNRQVEKIM